MKHHIFIILCITISTTLLALPAGFSSIELGMSLDAVKEALQNDPNFDYRGEPEVSLLMRRNESILHTAGSHYIRKANFAFYNNRLYVITLYMDTNRLDYFTFYTRFINTYGEAEDLSPDEAYWIDEKIRLSLEKPLSVKYIDIETFEQRLAESYVEQSIQEISREEFLDQF